MTNDTYDSYNLCETVRKWSITSSSNSRICSPRELFGTRPPRLSKNESSVMMRSARFLALLNGSSVNGVDVSRVGLNNEAGFGESKRSEANGLKGKTKTIQCNMMSSKHVKWVRGCLIESIRPKRSDFNWRTHSNKRTCHTACDLNYPMLACSSFDRHCSYSHRREFCGHLLIQLVTFCFIFAWNQMKSTSTIKMREWEKWTWARKKAVINSCRKRNWTHKHTGRKEDREIARKWKWKSQCSKLPLKCSIESKMCDICARLPTLA